MARLCANIQVKIIEPYPSHFALEVCQHIPTVKYVEILVDKYDFIVTMDILEHVMQPLNLVYEMPQYCNFKTGGLLLYNCFYPVIKCHLPQTMYLRHIFTFLLSRMSLKEKIKVLYDSLFVAQGSVLSPENIHYWNAFCKKYEIIYNPLKRWYLTLKSLLRKI